MAHRPCLEKVSFSFPFGNTPATNFAATLAPEIDAEVLLLGCGDPRSILYTLYSSLDHASRRYDFTCCDIEPAILARNILLLTMITDGSPPMLIWRIFYHLFLDDEARQHLLAQCRRLMDISTDISSWNASKYGKFLRFCTAQSLADIRRMWELYLNTEQLKSNEMKGLKDMFSSRMKTVRGHKKSREVDGDTLTVRATNIFGAAPDVKPAADRAFNMYWSTGVLPINGLKTLPFPHPNPLFAFTRFGRGLTMHPSLHPIASYHLGHVVALAEGKVNLQDLIYSAQDQFSEWCQSFHHWTNRSDKLVIRMFCGNAVMFCRELRQYGVILGVMTPIHDPPTRDSWTTMKILLDQTDYPRYSKRSAPLRFNVIDTSTLSDDVGMLNILVAAMPLLQRRAWAILHTNVLLQPSDGGPLSAALEHRVLADIATFSLLLGLSPTSKLYHFSSISDDQDELASIRKPDSLHNIREYHQFISWRFISSVASRSTSYQDQMPSRPPLLSFDNRSLGIFLRSLFGEMVNEDDSSVLDMSSDIRDMFRDDMNLAHYSRANFVEVIRHLWDRVRVDWNSVMQHFFDQPSLRHAVPLEFEELKCGLCKYSLFTPDQMWPKPVKDRLGRNSIFKHWKEVPSIVTITIKVPRKSFRQVENRDPMTATISPALTCTIAAEDYNCEYSSLHMAFGDIVVDGQHEGAVVHIREDPLGWAGNSAIIITLDVPSATLMDSASIYDIQIFECQFLRDTLKSGLPPSLKDGITNELIGMIFHAPLLDRQHIFIARCTNIQFPPPNLKLRPDQDLVQVTFDPDNRKVVSMTIRQDIRDPVAARALANGAAVASHVISDSAIQLSFKGFRKIFHYPLPILSDQTKTRIARKSSYIEVVALIRSDFEDTKDSKLSVVPFPIAHTDGSLNLLATHYINLKHLQSLPVPLPSDKAKSCIQKHLALVKSEKEGTKEGTLTIAQSLFPFVLLKEQIHGLFAIWVEFLVARGLKEPKCVICLVADKIGLFAALFVNGLKLDQAAQTMVLDVAVVPVTKLNVKVVEAQLARVLGQEPNFITMSEDQFKLWRSLLPMFAERCRTWSHHTATCEFKRHGIPLGDGDAEVQYTASPLCSCGSGRDLGDFSSKKEWETLHPLATRVAISPLFSFSLHAEAAKASFERDRRAFGSKVPPNVYPKKKACAYCAATEFTLKKCVGCQQPRYCSRECQKLHWRAIHRAQCVAFN